MRKTSKNVGLRERFGAVASGGKTEEMEEEMWETGREDSAKSVG